MGKLFVGLLVGCLGVCLASIPSSPSYGHDLSADLAATVVGGDGDCGSAYTLGSVSCAAGTNLCGGEAKACGDVSYTSLVSNGAGGEEAKSPQSKNCSVCSGNGPSVCSSASVVSATKEADCNG